MTVHLVLLGGSSWPIVLVGALVLAGAAELVRLRLGRLAIEKARPDDLPGVMKALAKWRSPWHWKRE
jgi:hypothetical protein